MSLSRRLEPEESRQVRARLEKRWDIRDGFGSPTRSRSRRASVEKFHEEAFDDLVPVIQLALGSRGISKRP